MLQSYMKNVLINASAAKIGGASTIVRSFYSKLDDSDQVNYILICGLKELPDKKNVKVIPLSTSGIWSILFSALRIGLFNFWFRPSKIISFNNINYLFSKSKGITFFHQSKLFLEKPNQLKLYIYDWIIKHFLLQNSWVVQSEHVAQQLTAKYPSLHGKTTVAWPGFHIPETIQIPDLPSHIKGIFPVTSVSHHKNLDLFWQLHEAFAELNIHVATLLADQDVPQKSHYHHIKPLPSAEIFGIYKLLDFMVFTSTEESVGLPIFEFLQTGKPVFVYAAPYAVYYYEYFSRPENMILFNSAEDFKAQFLACNNLSSNRFDYSRGEWYKVFDLI